MRYNRTVEVLTTIAIVISYLGWVAAQIKALGLIFNMITHGAVSEEVGMILGTAIVLTYTTLGGMLSVAVLDFVQMIVVIGGLLYIGSIVSGMTGGDGPCGGTCAPSWKDWTSSPRALTFGCGLTFLGGWVTMMLGSIPQQDVFQRITSAKSAKIALWGSILGASVYFCFTFVPMFIAYSATLIDPAVYGKLVTEDSQRVLPTLVLEQTPLLAQAIFFGAVLSAIMSCSSATLLAPSVSFAENIVKGYMPHLTDKGFLRVMRFCLVGFAVCVLLYALNSELSIFGMVESAYKITLAGAFIPLIFGAFWKRSTSQGALAAIIGGISSWVLIEVLLGEKSLIPAQLIGLGVSAAGMVIGSLLPQKIGGDPEKPHGYLHEHAARPHQH